VKKELRLSLGRIANKLDELEKRQKEALRLFEKDVCDFCCDNNIKNKDQLVCDDCKKLLDAI
jgi:hypothetical protein